MKKLNEAVEDFLHHCQFEKNLSPKTIKAYGIDLGQFLEFVQTNEYGNNIEQLNKEILKAYLHWLSKFKPKTIKRKIATIKAFLNEMELEEIIAINPFRRMRVQIKEPITLPIVMNSFEIEKLIQTVWDGRKLFDSRSYCFSQVIRDIAVVEVLFATGIRVSELCNLKMNDIDLLFQFDFIHSFVDFNFKFNLSVCYLYMLKKK